VSARWSATDVQVAHVDYVYLVGLGLTEWRCSCGATGTLPAASTAMEHGNAHLRACRG